MARPITSTQRTGKLLRPPLKDPLTLKQAPATEPLTLSKVEIDRSAVSVPSDIPLATTASQLQDSKLFLNRELSWLEFNARVLDEAAEESLPLFERLKFLAIFSSNLDEFFMVRVAGLQAQLSGDVEEVPPDGLTPEKQLNLISHRVGELFREQYRIFNDQVRPELRNEGVSLVTPEELEESELAILDSYFERDVFPVLTPIAIDPSHPFPHLRNKSITLGVFFAPRTPPTDPSFGLVQVPNTLARLIPVGDSGKRRVFVALEDLIIRHAGLLFPQFQVRQHTAFRVTRNFDIQIDEDEAEDLLQTVQAELRRRELGHAVRLEVSQGAPEHFVEWLCDELGLDRHRDAFEADGPLNLADMTHLTRGAGRRKLRDEPFTPQYVPPLRDSDDFFETVRKEDVLLHHPYESFEAVIDFLNQAAEDPNVLAIKQTLYRTGGESPLVRGLQRAAELGKQVTAVVELKARFDEESNIQWARALERSGVNVMYGLLGFKTHAKVLLIVRKEASGLRRYVHLATGNYNQQTARLYEDLSLFTAREELGEDATSLFNLLTGYSAPKRWNQLIVSPLGLHEAILGLIAREAQHAAAGKEAGIVAKMNSLVDADVISALYAASQAGVRIDLLVRGICCLRPGLKGISENIRVHAIIDRFLEHARIFHFKNAGQDEVYCSSADWMPRNFRRRVEAMYPISDPRHKDRVIGEILYNMRNDSAKGWLLQSDGTYTRTRPPAGAEALRSQQVFMNLARERAKEADPKLQLGSTRAQLGEIATLDKLRRKSRKKRRRRGKAND